MKTLIQSGSSNKNTLAIDSVGRLTLELNGRRQIDASPVGHLVSGDRYLEPVSAKIHPGQNGFRAAVSYECGDVIILAEDRGHYFRLTVASVPEKAQMFVFGPYFSKGKISGCGEMLGAAWDDATAVCIQSLNPKTLGGFPSGYCKQNPYFAKSLIGPYERIRFAEAAAVPVPDGATFQCYAEDMSVPKRFDFLHMHNVIACEVPADDARIAGASVALFASAYDELLDTIGTMEINENLPHPTIDGKWAKTSPLASASYMMIHLDKDSREDRRFEWLKRAGLRCLYSWSPFKSWGHFEIDPALFAGGDEGYRRYIEGARAEGIEIGFHTLSNFINTCDPYVTPVPHDNLLAMDNTTLTDDIHETSDIVGVADKNNFTRSSTLNVIRIGDELIVYTDFDADKMALTGCVRGAFGTRVSGHGKGDSVCRLWDHSYKTLFPDLKLQNEMADRLGSLIARAGIRRISFDGLEGCLYTGRGEYASSDFVRRVFEKSGSELLCDASISSHYRWHAHSYYNWGEPYYDYRRRGGMFGYRAFNQAYFKRNLIPGMLGQYDFRLCNLKFEATNLENFEFMLSQTIAHDAGFGFECNENVLLRHGLTDRILDAIRIWDDMRFHGKIPREIREAMKDEHANWHLEETDGGWTLYRLRLQEYEFHYCESIKGNERTELICIDYAVPKAPLKFRLRIGNPGDKGTFSDLAIYPGWGGIDLLLSFELTADAGDYLVYDGGMTIEHCDSNYKRKAVVEGKGSPVIVEGVYAAIDVHWKASADAELYPHATVIQNTERIFIPRANC